MKILIILLSKLPQVEVSVRQLIVDDMLLKCYSQASVYAVRDATRTCGTGVSGFFAKMVPSYFSLLIRTVTKRLVKLEELRALTISEIWIWALLSVFSFKEELLSRWVAKTCPVSDEVVALEFSK